jgi:ABC-2 type transporter
MSHYRSGNASHFFIFFAVNLLIHFVNVSFAMWCVSLRRNFAEASLIANATFTFVSMACGFFLQVGSLPVYVRWIKYVSYLYWGFGALCSNGTLRRERRVIIEFDDNFFDCPYGGENDPACTAYTGNYVMEQLGIPRRFVMTGCLSLLGFFLFYFITTWLILRFIPVQISFSKKVKSSEREVPPEEPATGTISAEQRSTQITIRMHDLRLWIEKWKWSKRTTFDILQGIRVEFEPGKLNVIMGPSGPSHPVVS